MEEQYMTGLQQFFVFVDVPAGLPILYFVLRFYQSLFSIFITSVIDINRADANT
jgi:hypothetical protein